MKQGAVIESRYADDKWVIEGDYLVSHDGCSFLFKSEEPIEVKMKITDSMTYVITDNDQVTSQTVFVD